MFTAGSHFDAATNFNTSKTLAGPKYEEEQFGSGLEKSPTLRKGSSCSERNKRTYKSKSPSMVEVKEIMASMVPQLSSCPKTETLISKEEE